MNSLYLLVSLDLASLALLFWFTLVFDVPRYAISLVVISIFERKKLPSLRLTTSAVVAGYNEANSIRACVESINADQVIVVDDGSTDGMWKIVEQLKAEGLVHKAIRLPTRSSKITHQSWVGRMHGRNRIYYRRRHGTAAWRYRCGVAVFR